MKRRLAYWFYRRRAHRLETVARFLGWDEAIEYGQRRGWIKSVSDDRTVIRLRGRSDKQEFEIEWFGPKP